MFYYLAGAVGSVPKVPEVADNRAVRVIALGGIECDGLSGVNCFGGLGERCNWRPI